jgi:hypothetical protein
VADEEYIPDTGKILRWRIPLKPCSMKKALLQQELRIPPAEIAIFLDSRKSTFGSTGESFNELL